MARRVGTSGSLLRRLVASAQRRVQAWRRPEPEHKRIGRLGETAAAEMLEKLGYRIIERNVHVPMGEADIVCDAPDRETKVVVEVKTRVRRGINEKSDAIDPEESVTAHKERKLISIARWLAKCNRWDAERVRIDVVAVEYEARDGVLGAPSMRHTVGAVTPGR